MLIVPLGFQHESNNPHEPLQESEGWAGSDCTLDCWVNIQDVLDRPKANSNLRKSPFYLYNPSNRKKTRFAAFRYPLSYEAGDE